MWAITVVACGSTNESLPRQEPAKLWDIDARASAEELYFEVVRLHSAGVFPPDRMDALQRALDEVDGRYQDKGAEYREQQRVVLASCLQRVLSDSSRGEDAALIEALYEGRAYAQKLHRTGVHKAQQHAENALLIAGMMGVPTSKEDLVLMVGIPMGGYVVVKVGGMAIQRAAFLMRKFRSVDDVVEHAKAGGFQVRYAANDAELRRVAGETAAEAAHHAETHVGAPRVRPQQAKENPWNPSNRNDNCTACVSAVIYDSMEGYFKYTADDMERIFGYTGRERGFTVEDSLEYIEKATGLQATSNAVTMMGKEALVGHYAIFTRWSGGGYQHVLYGRVTATGKAIVFDPQSLEHMTYQQMMQRYGKARPHRLEMKH